MREIRTSGLTSGDGKRGVAAWPKPPRPSSTLQAFGRKRRILVDASGLILLAHIHAASLHAFVGARPRVEAAPVTALPRLELIWAHGACTGPCAKWLERQISWRIKGPYA